MPRIAAVLVGGPLDGRVYSVEETQKTIEGMEGVDDVYKRGKLTELPDSHAAWFEAHEITKARVFNHAA